MTNKIIDQVKLFYSHLIENKNHRFQSWEHCYLSFSIAFRKNSLSENEKDLLSLHLAFYLASWGMYRGSSFILQKDYKAFHPIVDLLLSKKDFFNDHKIESLLKSDNDNLIKTYVSEYFKFDKELSIRLNQIRSSVKQNVVSEVSYTLKTKILLGTFGCIPAYDRFFEDGLRSNKNSDLIISYSENGVNKILKFMKNNIHELTIIKKILKEKQNKNNELSKVDYPFMKIIDMYFWKIGYDNDQKRRDDKNKRKHVQP